MAITSLDELVGNTWGTVPYYKTATGTTFTVGRLFSLLYLNGVPGSATTISAPLSGTALTTCAGELNFPTSVANKNIYLTRFTANSTIAGTLYLCDRLWHNVMSGTSVTSTGVQTINSATFPARDMSGGTQGEGVLIGLEVSTTMGAGTPIITMTYTASTRTTVSTTVSATLPSTMSVGSFIPIPLVSGDTGVKAIATWRQSASMTSGVYSIVAYRVLASVNISVANYGNLADLVNLGFPQLYDDTVPFFLWLPTSTTLPTITGEITYAQG